MKNDSKTPHLGMIVTLGAIIVAIWMLAIYGTIQEEHEKRYDVTVRPGAVSYGTHSFATMPMVSAPTRHTAAPMISGNAVRSYAHYGHASYAHNPSPITAIHTTSSATVHTIGSGGASGGLSSSPSGDRGASSSRGIAYGGGSVSMPTLALATTSFASSSVAETAETARYGMGPRRSRPTTSGTGDQWSDDGKGDGDWYRWDDWAGEWVEPKKGDIRPGGPEEPYDFYRYDESGWIPVDDQGDPILPSPLGDAPWHWMLLLALGYGIAKIIRPKHNTIQ